jgi:hypothetical protein
MDTFLYRTGAFEKYGQLYVSRNVKSILYTIGKVLCLFIEKVWEKATNIFLII